MAGGAGANAAAGMVEEDAKVLCHVEKRHGLAMVFVGQGAVFELNGLALRKEGDAHQFIRRNIGLIRLTHCDCLLTSLPHQLSVTLLLFKLRRGHRMGRGDFIAHLLAGCVHGFTADGGRDRSFHHQLCKTARGLIEREGCIADRGGVSSLSNVRQAIASSTNGGLLFSPQLLPGGALRGAVEGGGGGGVCSCLCSSPAKGSERRGGPPFFPPPFFCPGGALRGAFDCG